MFCGKAEKNSETKSGQLKNNFGKWFYVFDVMKDAALGSKMFLS